MRDPNFQKHVVYILGAGFSADLGLPVMANFIERANDLAESDPDSQELLNSTLATIERFHVAATFYATDVFNIEEVLSLLEMQGRLQSRAQLADFRQFIKHVIGRLTPDLAQTTHPVRWQQLLFWDHPWEEYCAFVANLHGYTFSLDGPVGATPPSRDAYRVSVKTHRSARYSVISLNYDLVLELASDNLNDRYNLDIRFGRSEGDSGTPLAKLHGSIDAGTLVPPTWQKTLDETSVRDTWIRAYNILRTANEVRIIGYSLPESDAYVRYLLKAAAIDTPNLKRIDVICRDETGRVKARYDEFVRFHGYRFITGDTLSYLARTTGRYGQWPDRIDPDHLEFAHQEFCGQ